MRLAFISVAAFVLIGASPVEESEKLIEAGRGKDAVVLLEKAAQDGDAGAIDQLAWLYDQGKIVPQDLARAAELYRQAAEAGNSHAQWAFVMLDMGQGIKEDPVEAVKWFEKAADQGDRSAIVSLAVMHANGRGVAQDFAQARRLYLDAAKRGEPHAFFGMGLLYLKGQGVERD